jgi:N6-L-threonylcarbamoyladenine synthase
VVPQETFPAVAAAFQDAAVEILVRATLDAAVELGARCVTATGGVAANGHLRERLAAEAHEVGLECAFPPKRFCTDNAAIVAGRGHVELLRGARDALDIDVNARPERAAYDRARA